MQKRKKRYIIIIMILVSIIFYMINSIKYDFLQEDVIFFQFLNSKNQSRGITNTKKEIVEEIKKEETTVNTKTISFHVQYQNTKMKAINLTDTVDNKTLVYEKIAPGTSGGFEILLKANQNMSYKIEFESKNEKPNNLQFYTKEGGKRYSTLEELGENLIGEILENEEEIVPIYWEWKYETNQEQNKQDTLEAKKMREYHFLIYVQGC